MDSRQATTKKSVDGLEIRPFAAPLAAEIVCADVRQLGRSGGERIHQALLDHLVIVFRDQTMTDEDLIAFTGHFGELKDPLPASQRAAGVVLKANPHVSVISNVVENGVAIGNLGDGEAEWHADYNFNERPYAAAMLHALELPASGGDTTWCNMYAALETLPDELRRRIEGRTIKHDESYNAAGFLRRGYEPITDLRTSPGPSHPIVRTHPETGHNFLYLGRRRHAYVNDFDIAESEALLDALWFHALQPQFQWRHRWRLGDLLVWDNRSTMHHREAFDPAARRILHKTQTVGDRPSYSPAAAAAGPHPRGASHQVGSA